MLIALMVVLLFGGSIETSLLDGIADGRDEAKAVVEGDRRKDVLDIFKKLRKRTEKQQELVQGSGAQLASVLASGDQQYGDMDQAWWLYFEYVDAYNVDMLDLRYELREQLTRGFPIDLCGHLLSCRAPHREYRATRFSGELHPLLRWPVVCP